MALYRGTLYSGLTVNNNFMGLFYGDICLESRKSYNFNTLITRIMIMVRVVVMMIVIMKC
jgi:hypothetical protein